MASGWIRGSRRQHVLTTAYRIFARDGFHATGVDRVIDQAQVAKMTVYRHFPTKDDLMVAVLDDRTDRFDVQLSELSRRAGGGLPAVDGLIDFYVRWFHRADFSGCAFAHALGEYGGSPGPVLDAARRQKDRFRAWLRESVVDSAGATADAVADELFVAFEGAALLAELGYPDRAAAALRSAAAAILSHRTARS